MEKKKIGTLDAEFYLYWSESESKFDEDLARLIVEKVGIGLYQLNPL